MMIQKAPTYLAAGIPRSGSTWLFNSLRLLLQTKYRNLYAGWVDEIDNDQASAADAVLIKLHDPSTVLAESAVKIFTSHRDLRDIAVSVKDMGWANESAKMLSWVTSIRRFHDFWAPKANLDIRYTDITSKPVEVLFELSKACECDVVEEKLVEIANFLTNLEGDPQGKALHDAVTLMHGKHRFDGRSNRFLESLPRQVAEEIVVSHGDWLKRMGYDLSLQSTVG